MRPIEVAMANQTAEIIPFPIRKKLPGGSQWAVGVLYTHQLLLTACALMNLAVTAHEVSDDVGFYELIKAVHLTLERLLVEEVQTR